MPTRFLVHLLVFLFLAGTIHGVSGQVSNSASPLTVPRVSGEIEVDGRVDEEVWKQIPVVPLVQHDPSYGAPVSERSELRIAYDDRYLYFSGRCFDRRPLSQTTFRRDNWDATDDQIGIAIDSFNDNESVLIFTLYSTGARIDANVFNDGRTENDMNLDWNTFWDGAVSKDSTGWQGEIRIPLSSLRFQTDEDGTAIMGLSVYRFIARNQEMQVWPDRPPNWGIFSFVKPSKAQRAEFQNLKSQLPVYIAPYVLGGYSQNFSLNESESAYEKENKPQYEAGLDVKLGLTSNLTMDLTVNTDFAQVEADNQQVNLTRFSLFFPEKRQFFLERTSNFDFSFGEDDRVFYSRRIGIKEGEQIPLLGGARLVGRVGGLDVGFLSLQSAQTTDHATENATVIRLKKQVRNANSYVGMIATSQLAKGGFYNLVYGIDGTVNVFGDDYLRFNWAQTIETDQPAGLDNLDNGRMRVQWLRARDEGLSYDVEGSRAGSSYRPGLGFQARENFTQVRAKSGWTWIPLAPSPFLRHRISAENSLFLANDGADIETWQFATEYFVTTRSNHTVTLSSAYSYENLQEGFELSDEAEIPAGKYRFIEPMIQYISPNGRPVRITSSLTGGSFFDGYRLSPMIEPSWSITPNIQVKATYGYDRISFPDRNQTFQSHIGSARIDFMLDTRFTVTTFAQYSSGSDIFVGNARFRYNPREGVDLFLVYNEIINTDRNSATPRLPFSSNRTILAKYTYSFGL